MKRHILYLIGVVMVFASCSTAYKNTQTPDDMYYSPSTEAGNAKQVAVSDDRYEQYMSTNDDQYLRMRVQNRNMWSSIDDYSYWYDSRYDFGYGCSMSRSSMFYSFNPYYMRPWTSSFAFGYGYPYSGMGFYPFYSYGGFYSGFGYGYGYGFGGGWYSPMTTVVTYKNPKVMARTSANYLSTYRNRTYSNNNYNLKNYNARYNNYNGTRYNNGNTNGRYGNSYSNDNNYNNSRPTRSFTPSTPSYSPSRSSGSSFGGGGGGSMRSSSSGSIRPR
jgi:hypothetical protein